jgi:hypothetical protein
LLWLELLPSELEPLPLEPLPSELEPLPSELEPLSSELEPLPLEPVSSELEPLPLRVELAPPSSLCVLVDEPEELGVVGAVLEAAPLLPSAATATHAATKVARTPAVTRRRVLRRRCLTGEAGDCMPMIVADEAWIFLGIPSAPGKAAGGHRQPLRPRPHPHDGRDLRHQAQQCGTSSAGARRRRRR